MKEKPDRFEWKLLDFCLSKNLLKSGDRVLVSLSGGLDSICLAYLLNRFRLKIDLEILAVHFNHAVRADSDHDERTAADFCRRNGIEFESVLFGFGEKKDFQHQARQKRNLELNRLAGQKNCNRIATAHHLDDLVETQIWRFMRGTSLFNLHPLKLSLGKFIRPLLRTEKAELLRYAEKHRLEWAEDASNRSTDYTRNFIRLKIVPLFEECGGRAFRQKLLALAEDSESLGELLADFPEEEKPTLAYRDLLNSPAFLARERIHRFLISAGIRNIRREYLVKIHDFVLTNKGGWKLVPEKGFEIRGVRGQIEIVIT